MVYSQARARIVLKCTECICWSALAWSRILLVRTESAPKSHFSLKFLLEAMNSVHTKRRRFVTIFHSVQCHNHLWSKSAFHFWKVVYATFLFFDSGADISLLVLWSWRITTSTLVSPLHSKTNIALTRLVIATTCWLSKRVTCQDKAHALAIAPPTTILTGQFGRPYTVLLGHSGAWLGNWPMTGCYFVHCYWSLIVTSFLRLIKWLINLCPAIYVHLIHHYL